MAEVTKDDLVTYADDTEECRGLRIEFAFIMMELAKEIADELKKIRQ